MNLTDQIMQYRLHMQQSTNWDKKFLLTTCVQPTTYSRHLVKADLSSKVLEIYNFSSGFPLFGEKGIFAPHLSGVFVGITSRLLTIHHYHMDQHHTVAKTHLRTNNFSVSWSPENFQVQEAFRKKKRYQKMQSVTLLITINKIVIEKCLLVILKFETVTPH